MANWKKNRTYRKTKNPDGSHTYQIKVEGNYVSVTKEIYTVFAQAERQLEYIELDLKRDRVLQDANGRAVLDENGVPILLPEREVSLDKLVEEGWDFASDALLPEDHALGRIQRLELHRCLDLLAVDERALIDALFFDDLTERQYAEMLGISKTAIHARKLKVLRKINNLLNS